MAINPSLLIAAPILQDYLVDKDTGLPLAAGIITLYSETQRSILKPWYTQQGTNPPYSYVALPNPMTLSAVGTIQDADGNDVIPYFYPYEADNLTFDSYYITVYNSDGELQFTRSNFPYTPTVPSVISIDTNDNLIVNNCFWRNVGAIPLNSTTMSNTIIINGITLNSITLAPSQHDGNIMPDINYYKNAVNGTEIISFQKFVSSFGNNILSDDITPEFYMNINCSSIGSESIRYLQIPLSLHIASLSGYVNDSFTIQAMSVDGLGESLTVGIFQFCGSGVTSPSVSTKTITLGSTWNKFSLNLPIPSAQGITIGAGSDDALYIQIGFPIGSTFNVNIALPSFYLSNTPADNSFQTYDYINSIVSSPRTGDIRTSTNSFSPYGWTPMNDGVLALISPTNLPVSCVGGSAWPLFNLIWNLSKPYDTGSNSNPVCQMYTISGSPTNFGSTAYGDFSLNKALALTKMFGQVIMGTVPLSDLISQSSGYIVNNSYSTTVATWTDDGSGNILVNISSPGLTLYMGQPIYFSGNTLPSTVVANHIYYVSPGPNALISGIQFYLTNTFNDAISRQNYIAYAASAGGALAILSPVGSKNGEYSHIQSTNELSSHTHNITLYATGSGTNNVAVAGTSGVAGGTTNSTGSSYSSNIVQSSTFYNIFMKL
jgi:hypothetical protein